MQKIKAGLLLVLVMEFHVHARSQELRTGQEIPDMSLGNVINYRKDSLQLSDLKGRLVIIDFWNHACKVCIHSFPKIDSLQKHFGERIQFILVNKESRDSTLKFFSKRKRIHFPHVPMITGASGFISLFPVESYPYCIWVDSSGIISFMTGGYNITKDNIEKFLKGDDLKLRNTTLLTHKGSLFSKLDSNAFKRMGYYSYLSRCIEGLNVGTVEKKLVKRGSSVYMALNCASILQLYLMAYSENDRYNFQLRGLTDICLDDSMHYKNPGTGFYDEWRKNHSYTYELMLPVEKTEQRYKVMQEDLSRYFNIRAGIEKRMVKTICLVRTTKKDLLQTKGNMTINDFIILDSKKEFREGEEAIMMNQPFHLLSGKLKMLTEIGLKQPFLDETNYVSNIDIQIPYSNLQSQNLALLKTSLQLYGLDLVEKERLMDVLVLTGN